jgi:hypothetical protein
MHGPPDFSHECSPSCPNVREAPSIIVEDVETKSFMQRIDILGACHMDELKLSPY